MPRQHVPSIAALAWAAIACGGTGSGSSPNGAGGSTGGIENPSGTLAGEQVDRPGANARLAAPCGWLGVGWLANKIQFSPDGSTLAIHDDRHVKLLRASDWQPLHALPPLSSDVVDFAFTANDTIAISAAINDPEAPPSPDAPADRTRVHRVADGSVLAELSDPDDPAGPAPLPLALAASSDGSVLATTQRNLGADTLSVSVWSMPEAALVWTTAVEGPSSSIFFASLAVSPDGALVAVSTAGQAHLFDASNAAELAVIDGAGSRLAFSSDGSYMATGGSEGTMRLWRAATEAEVVAQSSIERTGK